MSDLPPPEEIIRRRRLEPLPRLNKTQSDEETFVDILTKIPEDVAFEALDVLYDEVPDEVERLCENYNEIQHICNRL